jgi:SAM-dependent methyltransferase
MIAATPQLWSRWRAAGVFAAELAWLARDGAVQPGAALRVLPEASDDNGDVALYVAGSTRLAGAVRCAPGWLPVADDTLRLVVLQHALDTGVAGDALLRECVRVLAPGGELVIFGINPASPWWWRARMGDGAAFSGVRPRLPGRRRELLRALGLSVTRTAGLGPRWPGADSAEAWQDGGGALRAVCALRATKGGAMVIPLRPGRAAVAAVDTGMVPSASRVEVAA